MSKSAITCETVTVTVVHDESDALIAELVVPAYTRPADELGDMIKDISDDYLQKATVFGEPVSLGDFALWLLRIAHDDPKEQA